MWHGPDLRAWCQELCHQSGPYMQRGPAYVVVSCRASVSVCARLEHFNLHLRVELKLILDGQGKTIRESFYIGQKCRCSSFGFCKETEDLVQ